MADEKTFAEFVRRIRAGDDRAAEELVRRYESLIRREIRLGIQDDRLNRAFDSMDVCQSVLASFFIRTRAGQYDLDSPAQLTKLLLVIARNKLASKVRHEKQLRRDIRTAHQGADEQVESLAERRESPSENLSGRELNERFQAALTDEERRLVELRNEGLSWDEIAARVGGKAQARRMQLSRAVDRIVLELGVED